MNGFSSKLPIWYQLSQALRTEILTGKLQPGQRIDAEVRLAKRHGISVLPVRQALRALEEERLIVRRRGSGTYVSETVRPAHHATTSLEALYSREFTRPAKILERGEADTPPQFAHHFPGVERLGFVRRLAYRDDAPWSYGVLYFPPAFIGKMTDAHLVRYPTYRLLRELYGLELARSHFEAKAVAAGGEVAAHLDIDPFSPALALSCVTFDPNDVAVGAFEMTFPSDPFVFSFDTPHEQLGSED